MFKPNFKQKSTPKNMGGGRDMGKAWISDFFPSSVLGLFPAWQWDSSGYP